MAFPLSDKEHAAINARIAEQPELVVAAAVRIERGEPNFPALILLVERPGRHGNCIGWLHRQGYEHRDHGFVTSHGRFVDRKEAAQLVLAAGQGSPRDMGPAYPQHLFSEDMWNDHDDQSAGRPVRANEVF